MCIRDRLRTAPELTKESIAGSGMMCIRTAYEAGRDPATKVFVEKAHLLQYLKGKMCIRDRSMPVTFP